MTGRSRCGRLTAGEGDFDPMITAKPLKRNDLQPPAPLRTVSNVESRQSRVRVALESPYSRDDTPEIEEVKSETKPKKNYYMKGKLFTKAILFIVNNTGGIDVSHVNHLVKEFAKRSDLHYNYSASDCGATLFLLYKRGLIDRFQYDGKYYYFQKGLGSK